MRFKGVWCGLGRLWALLRGPELGPEVQGFRVWVLRVEGRGASTSTIGALQ